MLVIVVEEGVVVVAVMVVVVVEEGVIVVAVMVVVVAEEGVIVVVVVEDFLTASRFTNVFSLVNLPSFPSQYPPLNSQASYRNLASNVQPFSLSLSLDSVSHSPNHQPRAVLSNGQRGHLPRAHCQ